jgi:hypothetical protein
MQQEHFMYLNRLRESGTTNMFGAAQFLQWEFGMNRTESKRVLMEWMQWVEQDPARVDE